MLPLAAHCPDLAREETKVVELAFGSGRSPTPVAFVERFCDESDCDCRRVTLQLVDLDSREELASVGMDFEETEAGVDRPVYFERTSRGDIEAHLLRAVVEGYVVHTDYPERLRRHYRMFRDVVESGASPPASPRNSRTNGSSKPLQDYSARVGELELDEVVEPWRQRAESPGELNRILRLFVDARSGYGTAFDAARTILEGLGIDIDRQQIVAASEDVSDTRYYPPAWREVVDSKWSIEAPLVDDILPLVAEALWERWTDTPRPHLTTKLISAGYEARYEEGPGEAWVEWAKAWRHVEVWLDARGGVPEGRRLTGVLDEALDVAEDAESWLHDVGRLVRELLRASKDDQELAVESLDLLASITARLTDRETVLNNNLDAARYASLRDLGRTDEAVGLLESMVETPTADTYAGLFLAHVIDDRDTEVSDRERGLVVEFIDGTLELADDEAGRLLREVRVNIAE